VTADFYGWTLIKVLITHWHQMSLYCTRLFLFYWGKVMEKVDNNILMFVKEVKWTVGSTIISTLRYDLPKRLASNIRRNMYTTSRSGQSRSFDSSRKRIGKQAIENRIDGIIQQFDPNWTNLCNKHDTRIFLKKKFFNWYWQYYFISFWQF